MIGRPEKTETAPYYFTYIDLITSEDVLGSLETQMDQALELFKGISEVKSLHRYQPEKWSIRQLLNHVNDTERAFVFRALWFARGFDSPLPGFDQDIAAAGAAAHQVSWASHVEEFQAIRMSSIAFFRNLPAEAWMRTGVASDNRFTVRALAYIVAGHVAHHLAILKERYL